MAKPLCQGPPSLPMTMLRSFGSSKRSTGLGRCEQGPGTATSANQPWWSGSRRGLEGAPASQRNNNLTSVSTAALVTRAQGMLTTMSAMGAQLQTRLLPALGAQLKLTTRQPQQFLRQNVPATADPLQNFPAAVRRSQCSLVGSRHNNLTADDPQAVSFVPIVWPW